MPLRLIFFLTLLSIIAAGADWPEFRGAGRRGIWTETGIVREFPAGGLRVKWRTPLGSGYSGPSVAGGRVFVMDFRRIDPRKGVERALALDEKTGKILWTREWEADYSGLSTSYAVGPRATPTVDGDRVYVLGAKGTLQCLKSATGEVVWRHDFVPEFRTNVPAWGMVSAPLVDGERLIAVIGGEGKAKVMAFDKRTGKELWRALESTSEPGYAPPVIAEAGGRRQLIIWHMSAVSALEPATGEVLWEQPFNAHMGLAVATPVWDRTRLLVSSFYTGSMMLALDPSRAAASVLWRGQSKSEIQTDGLHALINTPVLDGDYIYGICSYGQLRCLNAKTGERIWETLDATREKARWSTGFLVRNGDRYFLNNDRGELIIARLTPERYIEVARTHLIKPTSTAGIGRRELGAVNWSHPAYANRHIFARNDEEIISAGLGAP